MMKEEIREPCNPDQCAARVFFAFPGVINRFNTHLILKVISLKIFHDSPHIIINFMQFNAISI